MLVPPDELQLGQLLVSLKYGPLCEQFSQDAPVTQKTRAEGQLAARLDRPEGPSLVSSRTRSSTRRWRACTALRPAAAPVGGTIT